MIPTYNFLILYVLAFIGNNLFNYLHHLFYFFSSFRLLKRNSVSKNIQHWGCPLNSCLSSASTAFHAIMDSVVKEIRSMWQRQCPSQAVLMPPLHPWIPSISINPQTLHFIHMCWSAADTCMFHMTLQILIPTRYFKPTV